MQDIGCYSPQTLLVSNVLFVIAHKNSVDARLYGTSFPHFLQCLCCMYVCLLCVHCYSVVSIVCLLCVHCSSVVSIVCLLCVHCSSVVSIVCLLCVLCQLGLLCLLHICIAIGVPVMCLYCVCKGYVRSMYVYVCVRICAV